MVTVLATDKGQGYLRELTVGQAADSVSGEALTRHASSNFRSYIKKMEIIMTCECEDQD